MEPKSSDEHSSAAPSKWPFGLTIGLCAVVLVYSAVRLVTTGHASVFIVLISVGLVLQQASMFTRRPHVQRLLRYGGAVAILAAVYLHFRGVR